MRQTTRWISTATTWLLVSALAFGLGACSDDSGGGSTDGDEADAGGADEADGGPVLAAPDVGEGEPQTTHRFLISKMTFPFADENDQLRGFNLDGIVSKGNKPEDCTWADYTSPDGEQGIDNQMARLSPLFEPFGLGQAFAYLENSIEDSGFFAMFEVRGLDDMVNDDEVEVVFELGGGSAVMGPDADMVPWQTMCVQTDSPSLKAKLGRVEDGWLYAEFDELPFTISMFERVYVFEFRDLKVKARIDERGFLVDGLVGGTLPVSNVMALVIKGAQNTGGLLGPMTALMDGLGDMTTEDGPCTAISTVFDFGAVPVYFFEDSQACDPCGNDVCEYFESCETCLVDCCPGCGNGTCEDYPVRSLPVALTSTGFEPNTLDLLVGDELTWTNQMDSDLHLRCDHFDKTEPLKPGASFSKVVTAAATISCTLHEMPGVTQVLYVEDNYSEHCENCPGDCGDCPPPDP